MKTFLIKWCTFFAVIFLVAAYYYVSVHQEMSGDLGQIGHIPFGHTYDSATQAHRQDNALYRLVDIDSVPPVPVLLIGDSFTEHRFAMGQTISQSIADTITLINNVSEDNRYLPVQVLLYGLTHGCFHPGQVVILETVERSIAERLGDLDLNDTSRPHNLRPAYMWHYIQSTGIVPQKSTSLRSFWPFDILEMNDILTWLRLAEDYDNPVKHQKLVRPMFSHEKYADELFYYIADYTSCNIPQAKLSKAAAAVDSLMAMAERQGITLYLLVIPDKYDFFRPYFIDKEGTIAPNAMSFLDKVKSNRVINARDSLTMLMQQGEMDVWRVNDSHWGIKSAEYIGKKVAQRLKADKVLR